MDEAMKSKQPISTGPLVGAEADRYLERRLLFPMSELLAFPKYLLIETVNTCNARCIMCGIDFDKKAKALMTDQLFAKMADELGQWRGHVEKVMIYLDGEPLLDKTMPTRIRQMKAAGVKKVNIATNASLLDEKRGRALIEAGLDEIYITLDSLKKDVYEAIRVRLKFDEVYENIRTFIRLRDEMNPGLVIRVQMILQDLNHTEAAEFREHWKKFLRPHDQIVIQKAHNWANAVDVMRFGDEDDVNNYPCIALWGTFVVHVNGDAAMCCMDTETKHPLGSVEHQSIAEIWQGPAMTALREKHTTGRRADIPMCDGCYLWREEKHVDE